MEGDLRCDMLFLALVCYVLIICCPGTGLGAYTSAHGETGAKFIHHITYQMTDMGIEEQQNLPCIFQKWKLFRFTLLFGLLITV
jgi:hypothetical protein